MFRLWQKFQKKSKNHNWKLAHNRFAVETLKLLIVNAILSLTEGLLFISDTYSRRIYSSNYLFIPCLTK
ncbi:MAG: hypothetical protein CVT98_02035 [Bacteroidetes bacterium HGW-Bacteroidetes-15]|nr:MAG: hypothetical protein CVT98_02035 [Bacteroidetes bacterium HGW-Bacteroidetes-15]